MSHSTPPDLLRRLDLAIAAARDAGIGTLKWFRTSALEVDRKGDGSPVTAADRWAESQLRERIEAQFPADGILGEEFGEKSGSTGVRWVLDPIDGTKSFITGVPLYTTLVAVLQDDEPVLGVIFAPATGELIYAIQGNQTRYSRGDGAIVAAQVSRTASLSDATFLTSEVASFADQRKPPARSVYEALEQECRLTRTWGDAYGYLLVATGRADVMIDPVMNLWDAAALKPILEGAGGRFSDWQGSPTVHTGDAVAANPVLAEQVLQFTRGH